MRAVAGPGVAVEPPRRGRGMSAVGLAQRRLHRLARPIGLGSITVEAAGADPLAAPPFWRDRPLAASDDREPEHPRPHRGWPAVLTLTLIVTGFVVATALVIVLARTSTARWEKEKRPARAPRRPTVAGHAPFAATAARLPVAVARWVAAMRSPASRRAPLKVVAETLATAEKEVASRVGPFPRLR